MPAPRSSSRPIPGQGGRQSEQAPKCRTYYQDFSECGQYSEPSRTSYRCELLDFHVCAVPLHELPVLTKQGVGCSLRDFMEQANRTEREEAEASCSQVQDSSVDLPPPYVERVENDPVAIKVWPVSSDRDQVAKKNKNSEHLQPTRGDIALPNLAFIHLGGNIDRNILRPVLMQLLATSRARSGYITPRTAQSSRPSTPVPSVR